MIGRASPFGQVKGSSAEGIETLIPMLRFSEPWKAVHG